MVLFHRRAAPDPEGSPQELRSLFFEFEYSKGDVLLATEVTEKALQHMTKPGGPLRFAGIGQGRPMKFTGMNILDIEVMRRLQFFGVSHYASVQAREHFSRRVEFGIGGLLGGPARLQLVLYPYITPDNPDRTQWACIQHFEGQPEPWCPPLALVIDVDRVIDETLAKLRALCDDSEMPRFHPLVEATRHAERTKAQAGEVNPPSPERPRDPAAKPPRRARRRGGRPPRSKLSKTKPAVRRAIPERRPPPDGAEK